MSLPIQIEIILWLCVAMAAVGFTSLTITLYVSTMQTWKRRQFSYRGIDK